jgi:hypothetical protein
MSCECVCGVAAEKALVLARKVRQPLYPGAFVDGAGHALDAAYSYVMHFPKGQLPPSASNVWSISPYRENFYIRNELNRYGILSSMPLKYNADGSLDIYVQARSPGLDKESNWLPTPPSGAFNMTIRVYQPKKECWMEPTSCRRSRKCDDQNSR